MNPAEQETRELSSNSKLDQVLDQYLNDLQQGRACSRAEPVSYTHLTLPTILRV